MEHQGVSSVATIAERHVSVPEDELELMLEDAWVQAVGRDAPIRGAGSDFWRDVKDQLVRTVLANRDTASVTVGMIVTDVVEWANSVGIDADRYEYPLGLLAAWVMAGVLREAAKRVRAKPEQDSDGQD